MRVDDNTPAVISDLVTVESPITVNGVVGQIVSVRPSFHITHTFDADLAISLVSPDGTTVDLSSNNGGGNDNYGTACTPDENRTTFLDSAVTAITAGTAPFVGTFRPEQPLAAFAGKSGNAANGVWKIRVSDQAGLDTGVLQCWSLIVTSQLVAPTAADDVYSTPFGTALNVAAPGVLTNDQGNGSGAMTASLVTTTANGALTLNADGSFAYTPNGDFVGIDTFTYRPVNSTAAGAVATVSITVADTSVIQAPAGLYAASIAGNVVTLRWTVPAPGPDPTGFVLEGGVSSGQVLASIPDRQHVPIFTFVAPTGSFFVRMHSLNGAVRSAPSNEIRIHVNVPVAPSAPASLRRPGQRLVARPGVAQHVRGRGAEPDAARGERRLTATIPLGAGESVQLRRRARGTYTFRLYAANAGGVSSPPSNPVT